MIRPALPTDCGQIAAIWNPVIRDSFVTFNAVEKTGEELRATLEDKARADFPFLVAEAEGRVLGFATYGQFRGGVGYARTMEHTIILAPEARGRGLGRTLMAAIEDHARARGAHSMIAGVSGANPPGIAFHAALGYAEVAVLPEVGFKAGRWLDLVLMQKLLT
jgi:phosphinothricin acetyltransferase